MSRAFSLFLACAALLCGLTVSAPAQPVAASSQPQLRGVIKVARLTGEVHVTDVATALRTRLTQNSIVVDGQVVETGANSSVVLVLSNGAVVNVREDARLEITQYLQNPFSAAYRVGEAAQEPSVSSTRLMLRKGEIISQVKKLNREAGSSFTVETPVGAAGIRGTAFRIQFTRSGEAGRYVLALAEGLIQFIPTRGRAVEVGAGRQVSFSAQFNGATDEVASMPATLTTTAVAAGEFATLQGAVAEAVSAAVSVEFAPAPAGVTGPFAVATGTEGVGVATPQADAPITPITSALGSPPALPDAPRTTPPDGNLP